MEGLRPIRNGIRPPPMKLAPWRTCGKFSACDTYYRRYNSYPVGLANLGFSRGTHSPSAANLLEDGLAGGRSSGYLYTYVADAITADGRVVGFRLEAVPEVFGKTGRRRLSADQSGVVRYTDDGREPKAVDPAITPSSNEPDDVREPFFVRANEKHAFEILRVLWAACRAYRVRYRIYPLSLQHLGPPETGTPSEMGAGLIDQALASGTLRDYVYEYRVEATNQFATSFHVVARPQVFVRTGRISFLMDSSGVIRFTAENRSPSASDPIADARIFGRK